MDLDVHGLSGAVWRDDDFFDHAAQALEDEIARLALPQTFLPYLGSTAADVPG